MTIKCPACGKESTRRNHNGSIAACGLKEDGDKPVFVPNAGCGHLFYYDDRGVRNLNESNRAFLSKPANKIRTEQFLSQVREYYWG